MIPDVIFSLLKIHTTHSQKPPSKDGGFWCFARAKQNLTLPPCNFNSKNLELARHK